MNLTLEMIKSAGVTYQDCLPRIQEDARETARRMVWRTAAVILLFAILLGYFTRQVGISR